MTLGGLAPGNEIYNVSVWFGTGATRQLGWYPYSLYSFAQNRLPTPRGGLLAPVNGANFTLATGWVGKCAPDTRLRPPLLADCGLVYTQGPCFHVFSHLLLQYTFGPC